MTLTQKLLSLGCVGFFGLATVAHAGTFSFYTPSTATDTAGDPVDASATVAISAGTVTVTLTDLLINPKDVGQLISDFDFVLSNGATTGTLSSSSGDPISIGAGGSTTGPGTATSTGWGLNDGVSGGLQLDALGFSGPADLIIGPGPYTNANGSIANNTPHNPFVYDSATFIIAVTGVNSDTTVTSASFSFGTTAGDNVPGTPGTPPTTPEPSSLLLLGTGLLGVAGSLRRRLTARS